MNLKCKCGAKYRIKMPEFTGDVDAAIYTDGVVEGAVAPREINVFICDICKDIQSLSKCEQVEEEGETLLVEPTSEEYLEILKDEQFKSTNIKIKAWQKANDRYREIDSLDDLKVKAELLKATISQIPSITHFNQYITKMVRKKEALSEEKSIAVVEEKINELIERREEVFGRLKEKKHLKNIQHKIEEMEEIGEIEVIYTSQEKENMKILLDSLGGSSAEKILKAELHRNLGDFEKATAIVKEITAKQYEKIKNLIKDLSEKKLKKPARLNS